MDAAIWKRPRPSAQDLFRAAWSVRGLALVPLATRLRYRWRHFSTRHPTLGTYGLIAANVTVWGLYSVAPEAPRPKYGGLWRGLSTPPQSPSRWPRSWLPTKEFWERHFVASYQAVVSGHRVETVPLCTFMHRDGHHLLFNMVTLFFFGRQIEMLLGLRRFLLLYMASGTTAAASQVAACGRREPRTCVVGASGGVYALLSYMTCLMPQQTVMLYMIVPVPMWMLMAGLVAADVMLLRPEDGHTGHMVGAGCGAAFYLLRFRGWRW
mmetsp:Transcript_105937/g.326965  ORF Transcript_105937/g.326965 Transcript_105937/m.326965 type:complete len:266 (+) Transcript_105937:55-852(+)